MLLLCFLVFHSARQVGLERISQGVARLYYIYPVVIFVFLVGFRFNVGIDFPGYTNYFSFQSNYNLDSIPYSMGFYYLIDLLNYLNLPPQSLFVVMAFVQVVLLLNISTFCKRASVLVVAFYFLELSFINSLNVTRQAIAMLAVILFIYNFRGKNFFISTLYLLVALIFHKSALFFSIILLMLSYVILTRPIKYLVVFLILVSTLFADQITATFLSSLEIFKDLPFLDSYSAYLRGDEDLFKDSSNSIGGILISFLDVYLVLKGSDYLKKDDTNSLEYFLILFSVGAILNPIVNTAGYIGLQRAVMYFTSYRFIIIAFVLYLGLKQGGTKLERSGFVLFVYLTFYLLWFINAISVGAAGSAPYKFYDFL